VTSKSRAGARVTHPSVSSSAGLRKTTCRELTAAKPLLKALAWLTRTWSSCHYVWSLIDYSRQFKGGQVSIKPYCVTSVEVTRVQNVNSNPDDGPPMMSHLAEDCRLPRHVAVAYRAGTSSGPPSFVPILNQMSVSNGLGVGVNAIRQCRIDERWRCLGVPKSCGPCWKTHTY
jgi:hypothetical protein